MDGIATIVLIIVGLFLLYKTGVMALIQNSMTFGSTMADKGLRVMAEEQDYNVSKKLGKIADKYENNTDNLSSFKRLKAIKAGLDADKTED
jgi:hypothetical protein